MKKKINKSKGVVKGGPSGFVISLLVHVAAFMLAGLLVVFNVVNKPEPAFVPPPPVERPKMKLKKPQVKIKKSSKPKSTTRIVTKVKRSSMPNIQLPELGGMGDGLGGDIGGFEFTPELTEISEFGVAQSIGNDFVGTFYDFKRNRKGGSIDAMGVDMYLEQVAKFVKGGWNPATIGRYYRSPKKLYSTSFMIPGTLSTLAPVAFGERNTIGWCWAVHYKGPLVYPEDIKFRFWGSADDLLVVAVDGEMVLNGSLEKAQSVYSIMSDAAKGWDTDSPDSHKYWMASEKAIVGDWIELKAGEPRDMDVLFGEGPGGEFHAMLAVEVEGVEYERNGQGGPILPMFKTEDPSHELMDVIYRKLVPGEASVTNGPVFRDYMRKPTTKQVQTTVVEADVTVEPEMPAFMMRTWTTTSGKQFEAKFVATMGDKVVVRTPAGKQQKIAEAELSAEDLEYIDMANPPEFDLDFINTSSSVANRYKLSRWEELWRKQPPRASDYRFGAKVRQTGTRPYNHELTVEYFAIGQELIGNAFILLDRQSDSFFPAKAKDRSHRFQSDREVEFMSYVYDGQKRGKQYAGHLITLKDKQGRIIAHTASSDWLWENYENLIDLPVGSFFDKSCNRIFPTSPKPTRW